MLLDERVLPLVCYSTGAGECSRVACGPSRRMKTLSARAGCVNSSDECGNWSACSVARPWKSRLPPLSAAIRKSTIRAGGRDRSYLIYVPANLPPQAALVIVLHGSAMTGRGCDYAPAMNSTAWLINMDL